MLNDSQCIICLSYANNKLPCRRCKNKYIHKKCLNDYLSNSNLELENNCPTCRGELSLPPRSININHNVNIAINRFSIIHRRVISLRMTFFKSMKILLNILYYLFFGLIFNMFIMIFEENQKFNSIIVFIRIVIFAIIIAILAYGARFNNHYHRNPRTRNRNIIV